MKFTSEYIKMCQEATVLQEFWRTEVHEESKQNSSNREIGDFFTLGKSQQVCIIYHKSLVINSNSPRTSYYNYHIDGDKGGFFYSQNTKLDDENNYHALFLSDYAVWLPRQDQLQKLFWNGLTEVHKLRKYIEWINTEAEYNAHYTSLEELWLMFYIQEKYNKRWNSISNIQKWEEISH